jgi:hypothetical protein
VRSRVFVSYLAVQAALIGGFFFVPHGSATGVFWQVAVGWLAAAFALREVIGRPLRAERVRWLLAAGIFLNSSGILVQYLEDLFSRPMISPHPADAFWLALYPCLITGLAMIVYRRSIDDDAPELTRSTVISTVITMGLGVVAWKFVIVPQSVSGPITLVSLLITVLYPMGDLVMVALMLRLLLNGSTHGGAYPLMAISVLCFLVADTGWVIPLRSGLPLTPFGSHLLQAFSLTAFATMGAAAGHPTFQETAAPARARGGRAVLASLMVSLLIAPAILGIEALVDKISEGGP